MLKLWSASNIKVYGGGVAEAEFLNEVAQLVGKYRYSNMTKSRSKQGISYNYDNDNDRKERTLDVSDLASFPRGRAIMFASGAPAALLENSALDGRQTRRRDPGLHRRPRPLQGASCSYCGSNSESLGHRRSI